MADGLTSSDVGERIRQGLVNRAPRSSVRDFGLILARNFLTGFNAMVAPAAILLFALGDWKAAVAVSGMSVVNTLLGLAQEVRAKVHLDRLQLMAEGKVRVRRDGAEQAIATGEVVKDDVVLIRSGDTIVADGPVLESQFVEIDEALLTGESDPVKRAAGDQVLSGSVCVAGEGAYRAEKVGAESFAQKTSAQARHYSAASSPLTRAINRIVELLSLTAIVLCLVHAAGWQWLGVPGDEAIRRVAATITTMVPQGLVLSATLAFLAGAVAMGRRGAVVQKLSAIETMAGVDVVCTDKTGTLTTNRLHVEAIHPLDPGRSDDDTRRDVQAFAAASVDRSNRSIAALKQELGETNEEAPREQLPFKSSRRCSAIRFGDRVLVLGAVEALTLDGDRAVLDRLVDAEQKKGHRLLLLAAGEQNTPFDDSLVKTPLHPRALVALGDELRPDAGDVIDNLAAQGIAFKVVSGDNPETVLATVQPIAALADAGGVVTGDESATNEELIRTRGVFGRVAPEQKVHIVETLQKQGRRVAMIGDGVNDVLPIKKADLGIAMGSGSAASRTVAGLVLEGDRFELLPETLEEGRTIVRNLRRAAKLFLTKNVYSFILILAAYLPLGLPFPYVPQQVTLLNWSVIGIPAMAIALSRQRARRSDQTPFLADVLGFAGRTGIVFSIGGIALLTHATFMYPGEEAHQRTLFLSMLILLGVTVLFRALSDRGGVGDVSFGANDNFLFQLLGLLAIPVYLAAMYLPPLRHFFEIVPLGPGDWMLVALYTAGCTAATLALDRLLHRKGESAEKSTGDPRRA